MILCDWGGHWFGDCNIKQMYKALIFRVVFAFMPVRKFLYSYLLMRYIKTERLLGKMRQQPLSFIPELNTQKCMKDIPKGKGL